MTCKNCGTSLRTDYMFCPRCGAKVAPKRLTFKNLFTDVLERFFDLDNTFYRTVKTMTFRPEDVIGSYVDGVRRRFLNPMSYLGISLGLSGFLFFLMRNFAGEFLSFDFMGEGTNNAASQKIMDAALEYSTFFFLILIPVIAVCGYLSFNRRNYNLPEHMVSAIYTLAHISVITFPLSVVVLLALPEKYMLYSVWNIVLMIGFTLFVLVRLHKYPLGIAVLRMVWFTFLFMVGYLGLGILMNILALLFGIVELKDFLPPES